MNSHSPRVWIPLLACLFLGNSPILADEPAVEPEARLLLDDVAKAYKALPAYSDHGSVSVAMTIGDQSVPQSLPFALSFARPNKLILDAGSVRLTSDGTKLTTAIVPLRKFNVTPAPAKMSLDSLIDNPVGAFLFSGPTSLPVSTVLNLLWNDSAAQTLLANASALKAEADQKVDDHDCKVLFIEEKQGPGLQLFVDPDSKLLRRIELVFGAAQLARAKLDVSATKVHVAWSSGAIATGLPAEGKKIFTFEAPAGFSRMADLASRRLPGTQAKDPLDEWLGKPAPDFTLTVLDGPDKTREIRKADLLGKVVILDFWATWCAPCMAELPEIQKLVDHYAKKNAAGVVVVALSQDSEPGELAEIRKLVEQTLTAKDLNLAQNPTGLVALDPIKSIGKSFQVTGIPTVVVLDAKGIVQAIHVGFSPDVLDTLTNEVETLLEGRPLVDPKPAATPAKRASEPK